MAKFNLNTWAPLEEHILLTNLIHMKGNMNGKKYDYHSIHLMKLHDALNETFLHFRTMYNAYTGPRAFLPHSAINLSVKTPAEVGSSTVQSSLDLSVPEGGSPYLLNPAGGGQVPPGYNSVPNANNVSSPQILDLTRTTNMIR